MNLLEELSTIVGDAYVQSAKGTVWEKDWMGNYVSDPVCVVRPAATGEVAEVVKLAGRSGVPVVPVSGNTGLAGGTQSTGAILLSLDRMNRIRDISAKARTAVVDAGVVLSALHEAAEACDLAFPLTFGAKGSAMIGGCLSTNAGGSNVLRYGNTRDLCLGVEVVLPSGEVMNLMGALHKDNSGYALKHLMIGAEGTLGIITAAVVKLVPKPGAYATAMVAVPTLDDALGLLNDLQEATGGAVEAFEYMPRAYVEAHLAKFPQARAPFEQMHEVNILVEVGATAPRDVTPDDSGQVPIAAYLEEVLGAAFEAGTVVDAVVAQNQAQRVEMWERREAAAEVALGHSPIVNNDIAVPLDKVSEFLERMDARLVEMDAGAQVLVVAHLGDGNVHYTVWPGFADADHCDAIMEAVEDEVLRLGGSFSAEHGIGLTKRPSMARRKDGAAIGAMRAIKAALDPLNIMNPGKVLPPE